MNVFDILFVGAGLIMGWGACRLIPGARPRSLLVAVWLIAVALGSLIPLLR